ncbi:MAG TPA: alpha/beta fold hydrolase [Chitinophagales bacterium]|nr:alpha/beta fold hydrolase [Chitinophagales bacterium]
MKDIILLHGAIGSKEQLEPLRKLLSKKGFKAYSMNFFGHGGEPFSKEGFGIKVFCWQLQNFIRENKLQKPMVFGYSMGGYVALRLACKFPNALGDIVTLGTKFDWTPQSAKQEIEKLNPKKIEEKNPAFAASLKKLHAPADWKELLSKTCDMLKSLGKEPLLTEKEFAEIENNVTICLGDRDTMVTREESEKAAEALPNGKFEMLKNTPHPIEKADAGKLAECIANL